MIVFIGACEVGFDDEAYQIIVKRTNTCKSYFAHYKTIKITFQGTCVRKSISMYVNDCIGVQRNDK
jgi:hypothetical protein